MSLSYHLEDPGSPVRKFLYANFPNTLPLVRQANTELRATETIRPKANAPELAKVRPADRNPYPYSDVGMAIDYRFRYYFSATGEEKLVARQGGYMLANKYRRMPQRLIDEFFTGLEATLLDLAPANRRLSHDQEMLLNRYCFVLALLEQAFRMPPVRLRRSLLFFRGEHLSVSELLAIPQEPWLEDMQSLSWLFYEKFKEHLAGTDFRLNPTFEGSADIGGADADLIVNHCLIDIKTTVDPRVQNRIIYQLMAYVLLDYNNECRLREVGLYFSRQGITIRWSLESLLDRLCADTARPRLPEIRERFQTLLLDHCERKRSPISHSSDSAGPGTPFIPPEWIA